MSDPRQIPDPAFVTSDFPRQIVQPVVNLRRSPNGPRDRQLLLGAELVQLGEIDGWAYVKAALDGYVGYVKTAALGPPCPATHMVTAPCTHAYASTSLKSADLLALSHLSRVTAISQAEGFIETSTGFIPAQHVAPVDERETDPASVATRYLGTDYLWGGNSRWGIDCSGLVQAALTACGVACPGDSDQQMAIGIAATAPYRRNDLLFWKGHVALVSDPETIIHANAHTMAVTYEPIEQAITRIANSGDGPVTAHRRLPSLSA